MDETEELIHQGDKAPDTPQNRRRAYWNNNKHFLLGGLAVALVLGSLLYTVVLRSSPDYMVGLVTAYAMPEAGRKQLEELLTVYADDRNGDGKVVVELTAYPFVPETSDVDQWQSSMTQFTADAITNSVMVYLCDKPAMEALSGTLSQEFGGYFQYTDGKAMPRDATDYENAMAPWAEFQGLAGFSPNEDRLNLWDPQVFLELCQSLHVVMRAGDVPAIQEDPEAAAYYSACTAYVERIRAGEAQG